MFPARYESLSRLGSGGGGDVWRVRDRVTQHEYALKILPYCSEPEEAALIREASVLFDLTFSTGMRASKVERVGRLANRRLYFVREVVEGESLADCIEKKCSLQVLVQALVQASLQLTYLHRVGLLHGDIKPTNLIVRPDGTTSWVDLGLAATWGSNPNGVTVRYAAPELFEGKPLTVRSEIYALGISLRDILEHGIVSTSDPNVFQRLQKVEQQATALNPQARFPSADEFASALAAACDIPLSFELKQGFWSVLGVDSQVHRLMQECEQLAMGTELSVYGAEGRGGRTLMAMLAWHLEIQEKPVAWLRKQDSQDALLLELATALGVEQTTIKEFASQDGILILEDPSQHESILHEARTFGVRIVARRFYELPTGSQIFNIQPLDERDAIELTRRALPSLPEAVWKRIVERSHRWPGLIQRVVQSIANQAIVRAEDIDALVDRTNNHSTKLFVKDLDRVREWIEMGHIEEAEKILSTMPPSTPKILLEAWIYLNKGEYEKAHHCATLAIQSESLPIEVAESLLIQAKIASRQSDYTRAFDATTQMLALPNIETLAPTFVVDALQTRAIAHMYQNEDAQALVDLDVASTLAQKINSHRWLAVTHSSRALVHQRAGRTQLARDEYRNAILYFEQAGDVAGMATARLNIGTLAWSDGELDVAIGEFEAAVDLAQKSKKQSTVERALTNLALLDLHLGRYERVANTLTSLTSMAETMTPAGRAFVASIHADFVARTGAIDEAQKLYEKAIEIWRSIGRMQDAAEVKLDALIVQYQHSQKNRTSDSQVWSELSNIEQDLGARVKELKPQLLLTRALVYKAQGDWLRACNELEQGIEHALTLNAKEWLWQLYGARASVFEEQAQTVRALRDRENAVLILEEIAAKLPQDLREVFWNEPRRNQVRDVRDVREPAQSIGYATMLKNQLSSYHFSRYTALSTQEKLTRILEINRELVGEVDLKKLLNRITDYALDLVGADRGFVLIKERANVLIQSHVEEDSLEVSQNNFQPQAARNHKGETISVHFSRSIAEEVLATGEPIVTNTLHQDPRFAKNASVHALSIHAVACIPIVQFRTGDRTPIGVLYLEIKNVPTNTTLRTQPLRRNVANFESELPILLAFADQVAIAIENARSFEESRKQNEKLQHLNQELENARAKLDEVLARRTEQLERTKTDLATVRQALRSHAGFARYKGLVGNSEAMRKVYALIERVANTDVSALILGESGTGKEVVARAIHHTSARSKGPFVGINCGAIPANLLESELFGYTKGAFSGADRDRKGMFQEAFGGTILLDEIGEMPLKMQTSLLRVLQEKVVRPLGAHAEQPINVRVLCATHRNLQELVLLKQFREDLLYRINVVPIPLPPLRERLEDIPLLTDYFLGIFATHYQRERKTLSREAITLLQQYHWPGNVRQFEHVLLNAFILTERSLIEPHDLQIPNDTDEHVDRVLEQTSELTKTKENAYHAVHKKDEKKRILKALQQANWNRVQASILCGIPRRTFYRRLKEYGIQS